MWIFLIKAYVLCKSLNWGFQVCSYFYFRYFSKYLAWENFCNSLGSYLFCTYTASKKFLPLASVWTKTILISGSVGRTGAGHQTWKMRIYFLMSLVLRMPIFNKLELWEKQWKWKFYFIGKLAYKCQGHEKRYPFFKT